MSLDRLLEPCVALAKWVLLVQNLSKVARHTMSDSGEETARTKDGEGGEEMEHCEDRSDRGR
eukprot:9126437-Alexandrium_andersonii.AAC.1